MKRVAFEASTLLPPRGRPLLERHAGLHDALPAVTLASLPTPVTEHAALADGRCAGLFVKRDDRVATPYGGNKIRKLEFLLGAARAAGAKHVMTFGVAGSNHALATAVCAARTGLRGVSLLTPQTNARYVAKNLRMSLAAGAELHYYKSQREADAGARFQRLRLKRRSGAMPALVPGGGSSALGTVGFVNAALELAEQVDAGVLPVPDRLYVALGTMGTVAGLALGLRLAGLPTRVVAVRVVHENIANAARLQQLLTQTAALLSDAGVAVPPEAAQAESVDIRHECFGRKYAVFTDAGMAAIERAAAHDITLDGTYTGKAFAALLGDLDSGALHGRTALFWNTYSSAELSPWIEGVDDRELPPPLRWYVEAPVQRRDRAPR